MLQKRFKFLIGHPAEFSLESRIFHSISLISMVPILVGAVLYAFGPFQYAVYLSICTGLVQFGLYYLSRFKNQLSLAISLSVINISITRIGGYIFNAGVSGNSLLLSAVTLFIVLLIVPKKHRLIWFLFNALLVLTLLYLEFQHPVMIQQHYDSRPELFFNMGVTYFIVIALIYVGTVQLRKSYDEQKELVEEKALSMLKLNEEKDKLFSIISHDLNAPMSSVKQYLDLLQTVELEVEERRTIEKSLARSLDDASTLLNNLLLWAKNQMQLNYVQVENIGLQALLTGLVQLFQTQAELKKINVQLYAEDDLYVKADQNMLNVVLRNLLNNAIKFSHIGGNIEIHAFRENGNCIIRLKDNGIGIKDDKQDKIFTLNVSSSYGTANEKGTGLGLILSKDFMVQQGGDLWFESAASEGTTFYVSLPMGEMNKKQLAELS
ncbi:sensor histidine kinase [Pedobacter immunditicola]|uniref:sensor histidine kinase n=1 Tax=Pedobacter immunditicola TaxID=3133440 RepID=UPI0030A2FAF0